MKKLIGLANLGTAGAAAILAMSLNAAPAAAQEATLYKNPQCGCCESYADYLRENGFTVEVKPTHDLAQISRDAGIPDDFQGCHTTFPRRNALHACRQRRLRCSDSAYRT